MPTVVEKERAPENWRLLDLSYGSVFENLAVEEALARGTASVGFRPTIRFWVNPPSVVLGRFQRTEDEVDTELCEEYRIQIARRFTGGGAVFHDEGNLNFTIVNQRNGTISPTKLHEDSSRIVLNAISRFGVKAKFLSPNSILIAGRKVSGSAAAFGGSFALWHSSILISSNLDILERVLAPSKKTNSTSFVRSRWHPVSNLHLALGKWISLDKLKSELIGSLRELQHVNLSVGRLCSDEEAWVKRLLDTKYSSSAWNRYGNYKET